MDKSKVLLLNSSYEPLRVISLHRAILLMVEEKVVVEVASEGRAIRSPSITLPFPSVVRLIRYVKVPLKKRNIPISRRAILNRDNKLCAYCGKLADTIDHIIPRSKGGKHTWLNVIAACRPCNAKKGHKMPEEWGVPLRFQPFSPEDRKRWAIIGVTDHGWDEYLQLDLEGV